jgi:hypothetical protein
LGFVVWTVLNLLAGIYLAHRAAQFFPAGRRWWIAGFALTSLPVVYALLFGQPILLLACAFAEAYISFRRGEDFRAGLWISCLLIKPQYGLLIGLLLLWKRQWRAVLGSACGVAFIVGASAVLVGPAAFLGYPSALRDLSSFNGVGEFVYAPDMINWRGIVLRIAPNVSDYAGLLIVLALGVFTVALAMFAWRGPWEPRSPKFPAQMVILVLATLLANYHSHAHGASLLVVPLAALIAERWPSRMLLPIATVLVFVPTVVYLEFHHVAGLAAWPFSVSMLLLLGSLVWDLRGRRAPAEGPAEFQIATAAVAI